MIDAIRLVWYHINAIMKNKDAQRLAKLSVKKRKETMPPEYWKNLAKAGAKARWKNHKKVSTDGTKAKKDA